LAAEILLIGIGQVLSGRFGGPWRGQTLLYQGVITCRFAPPHREPFSKTESSAMPRRKFEAWAAQADSRVALVGGSGWVGAALADRVLAAGLPADRLRIFTTLPRWITVGGSVVPTEPLSVDIELGGGDWLILHAGSIGAHRLPDGDLSEFRRLNDGLLNQVLTLAGTGQVRRLVMVSSGGVHRPDDGGQAKSAYSRMKRDHEATVSDWASSTASAVLLPRVFNLGGPYISAAQYYALGSFILSAARTGRVAIGSGDPVFRQFTHVLEMSTTLLDMAVDETEGPVPFDIAGGEIVELGALAALVATEFGLPSAVIDRPAPSGRPEDRYVGDGRRYQTALIEAAQPPIPLARIVADTVAYLRETSVISPSN
jgi:nucleoside-diphosphate-sugar epimerase